jgi:hypothetical protein
LGRILSPIINAYLQLRVDCVTYHSGDYRTERLDDSITHVLHVVQIHIKVIMYSYVLHHVRILDKNLSGTRSQVVISSDSDDRDFQECGRLRGFECSGD